MTMDQADSESNGDAPPSEIFEQIEFAANGQIELCIAGRLILDRLAKSKEMEAEPEILALQGIISAIATAAKGVLFEVEVEYSMEDLKCLHA